MIWGFSSYLLGSFSLFISFQVNLIWINCSWPAFLSTMILAESPISGFYIWSNWMSMQKQSGLLRALCKCKAAIFFFTAWVPRFYRFKWIGHPKNVKELNTLSPDCLCPMSVRLCLSDTTFWVDPGSEMGYGILPSSRGSKSWSCILFDLTLWVSSLE